MKYNTMKYLYDYLKEKIFTPNDRISYSYDFYKPFKSYKKQNVNEYLYLRINNFDKRLKVIEDKIKN